MGNISYDKLREAESLVESRLQNTVVWARYRYIKKNLIYGENDSSREAYLNFISSMERGLDNIDCITERLIREINPVENTNNEEGAFINFHIGRFKDANETIWHLFKGHSLPPPGLLARNFFIEELRVIMPGEDPVSVLMSLKRKMDLALENAEGVRRSKNSLEAYSGRYDQVKLNPSQDEIEIGKVCYKIDSCLVDYIMRLTECLKKRRAEGEMPEELNSRKLGVIARNMLKGLEIIIGGGAGSLGSDKELVEHLIYEGSELYPIINTFLDVRNFGEKQPIIDVLRCLNVDLMLSVMFRGGIIAGENHTYSPETGKSGREVFNRYVGELNHVGSIAKWLEVLSDPEPAIYFAAMLHDIERFRDNPVSKKDFNLKNKTDYESWKQEYVKYKKVHSSNSAEFAEKYLHGKIGDREYAPKMIGLVRALIEDHEIGETPKGAILRDADSLSFFETNIDWYLEGADPKSAEFKIRFMYERMGDKARELVTPMYALALYKLSEAYAEKGNDADGAKQILQQAEKVDIKDCYKKLDGNNWLAEVYKTALGQIAQIKENPCFKIEGAFKNA